MPPVNQTNSIFYAAATRNHPVCLPNVARSGFGFPKAVFTSSALKHEAGTLIFSLFPADRRHKRQRNRGNDGSSNLAGFDTDILSPHTDEMMKKGGGDQ